MRPIDSLLAVALSVVCMLAGTAAGAQDYPSRPVRLVLAYPPGGGTDSIGRIVALQLSRATGQPFVVDNRAGAGGTIATDIVAKAPRDGYTVLMHTISLAVNASLYPKLPFDTQRDLAGLAMLGQQPNALVVHPSVPARSVGELLELARSKPRQLDYASGGFGSSTYLAAELLKLMTKVEIVHVPYKGVGPALTALLAGQVQIFVTTLGPAVPHVKAGRVRALGVTSTQRSPYLPDVPTLSEAGVSGYEYSTWYGLWLPAGTSRAVFSRLYAEIEKLERSDEVKEEFRAQSVDMVLMPPAQFDTYVRAEIDRWAKVIRAAGAKPD